MFVFEKGKGRGEEEEEEGRRAATNFTYIQRNLKLTSQDDADDSMDEFVLLWTEIDEASPEGPATPNSHRWMCHSGICWVYEQTMSSEAAAISKDSTSCIFGVWCCNLFTCNKWLLHRCFTWWMKHDFLAKWSIVNYESAVLLICHQSPHIYWFDAARTRSSSFSSVEVKTFEFVLFEDLIVSLTCRSSVVTRAKKKKKTVLGLGSSLDQRKPSSMYAQVNYKCRFMLQIWLAWEQNKLNYWRIQK